MSRPRWQRGINVALALALVGLLLITPQLVSAAANWCEHTINRDFDGAASVYAIDVDGDGDIDILGAAEEADDITWWENDGSQNFTEHIIDDFFDSAQSVYATDVDGDGDIDVLGAAYWADDITWWENDGSQNFTEHTIKGDFDGARSVYATDVDGDGDIDVLGAAYLGDAITWWENVAPTIAFTPASFSFNAVEGGANPDNQTLEAWNSVSGVLDWSVSDNATWLSLSPASGSSAGEHDNITLSVDITGLTVDTYNADITISDPLATNTPQTVSVSLTIDPAVGLNPTVDAVGIYQTDHTTPVTAMTPQNEYAVKVAVTDADTLADLSTVKVTVFYDSDSDDDPADVPGTGNTQTAAILTLTVGGTPIWAIDPSASTTWTIESGNCVQPTLTNTSGDFWFHFKPGKVATEATDWDVYAVADDGGSTPGTLYDGSDYDMYWYGEITVNTGSIAWGTLSPGTDFGEPSKQTGISVTYISNGAYDEQVASSGSWTGNPSGTATLNVGGSPSVNEFLVKADDTATLGSAVLVTEWTTFVTIDDTGVQTGENGDTIATNTVWLKLGTPFSVAAYSGIIYYKIIDGS